MLAKMIPLITCMVAATALEAAATDSVAADTVTHAVVPDSVGDPVQRPGLIKRIVNYFSESNKTRPTRHVNFSFIGGPHYSSDSKFGLGLVAAGLYSTNPSDTTLQPSNISFKFDATTAAHFELKLSGEHISPQDLYRIDYEVSFSSIDTKYWGIGYDLCSDDANESEYKYLASSARVRASRRFGRHFYIGPVATFDYVNARDFQHPALWEGLPDRMFSWGIGLSARYDTRDYVTAPHRGVLVSVEQTFNARWMGNRNGYSVNEFTAAWYTPVWRGATLASRLHSRLTWGDTPWGMLSYIGGSTDMRGYFEGRYRDKNEIDLCVELRQHVWRRNGMAVWGGLASVFPRLSAIGHTPLLPNWGIGYRWEFKHRMNVRVDLGFGRGQCGIIFNINEAF